MEKHPTRFWTVRNFSRAKGCRNSQELGRAAGCLTELGIRASRSAGIKHPKAALQDLVAASHFSSIPKLICHAEKWKQVTHCSVEWENLAVTQTHKMQFFFFSGLFWGYTALGKPENLLSHHIRKSSSGATYPSHRPNEIKRSLQFLESLNQWDYPRPRCSTLAGSSRVSCRQGWVGQQLPAAGPATHLVLPWAGRENQHLTGRELPRNSPSNTQALWSVSTRDFTAWDRS